MLGFSIKQIGIAVGVGVVFLMVLLSLGGGSQPQQIVQPITSISSPTSTPAPPLPVAQKAESDSALVTRVIDGDTIEIEGGQKIRYIGIDTPETVDPRKPSPSGGFYVLKLAK